MIYVTMAYWQQQASKLEALKGELARIRQQKSYAYENCGDGWHDNPSYHHLMGEERMMERRIAEETAQNAQFTICSIDSVPEKPEQVMLYTTVHVQEENTETGEVKKRTLSLVPLGAEDFNQGIFAYNVPRVAPLMGAKVGDVKMISIPMATIETTILSIEKMKRAS